MGTRICQAHSPHVDLCRLYVAHACWLRGESGNEWCFFLKMFAMRLSLPRGGRLFLICTNSLVGLGLPRHLYAPRMRGTV